MADKSARIKMKNVCRSDKEKVEIKSEINEERRQLLLPRKSLELKKQMGQIKPEPMDYSCVHSLGHILKASESSRITDCINRLDGRQIKNEMSTSFELCGDEIDHMLQQDRMKLLASKESSDLEEHSKYYDFAQEIEPAALVETPIASEAALNEDAPGLAQLLLQKGINMSEIKLYSVIDGNFSDLESVISKIFTRAAPSRFSGKSRKKNYFLPCLVALVEHARYCMLKHNNWPVEWGWSRDLNAFIFVFRKNYKVLIERPEYKYALYTFELSRYLSTKWQIKRIVITMKLMTCSCWSTIIKNRPLKVGDDLSEKEANVLREYGWKPNTGLGTMLEYYNYRDYKWARNKKIQSNWEANIIKLLSDGMDDGYTPMYEADIPKKAAEYCEAFHCDEEDVDVELKAEINEERRQLLSPRKSLELKKLLGQELPIGIVDQSKDVLNLQIKPEPMDYSHVHSLSHTSTASESSRITDCINRLYGEQIKSEMSTSFEPCGDEIDHMLLRDRMKLMASKESPDMEEHSKNYDFAQEIEPTHLLKNFRPRKHRKTATDSIEAALEEDAPGLAQVLLEKGIAVSEIKLYGSSESDEVIDDDGEYSEEGIFSELESLISKLFTQKPSLLKLPTLRSFGKSEKKSYCLACLVALVEQSRYLVFSKWPVEWGWCRDLNAFIFVFRRHNRIVLERPEYGYATYSFRLSKILPIKWQIKRLVITMKLANCSRTAISENIPLKVGDDLSEGEAKVLKEYGWEPNTGLGAMLDYYDRIVHTRNKVENPSEWKAKIVKLLTDGLTDGYTLMSETDIPKKAAEYSDRFGPDEKDVEF
ncbi:uncharacterized protein LOC124921454 isoform X2 [Impatiens glandulifera]|uniref:uncharacterized protein LOC124921454 isoform X2 n=1 Tax=Impatiens glandulifera TaxID=253017 RepID=UPI001FB06D60|nr:uncharacterized protein LOC124921454 isoform X2 [Impatiens glandulifera]